MGDDSSSGIIKFLIIGVAVYLGYEYLQSSGLWAQWFGGSSAGNSFATVAALQAYCTANPNGTAMYNGQTSSCAQWLQAIAAASGSSTAATATQTQAPPANAAPAAPSAADVALANSLVSKAQLSSTSQLNYWQWNYILKEISPSDADYDGPANANEVTAAQYVAARTAAGLSGLGQWPRMQIHSQIPYAWVN